MIVKKYSQSALIPPLTTQYSYDNFKFIRSALGEVGTFQDLMVKLSDIAKKLNLSLTTVSRALNNHKEVSLKTKELVKKAAEEMGYIPNKPARNLALKKSHLVGLVYIDNEEPNFYQSFSFEVIAGVRKYFGNTPYDLMIVPGKQKKEINNYGRRPCPF